MELTLKRIALRKEYTISRLFIDGVYFCDALEDRVRELGPNCEGKIMHQTAIPYGKYRIVIAHSTRFKRQMPLLLDVPCFKGILIHSGNTKDDTSGCLLIGENKIVGKVINSMSTFAKFFPIVKKAITNNQKVFITIC